jgi:hypothetical protein
VIGGLGLGCALDAKVGSVDGGGGGRLLARGGGWFPPPPPPPPFDTLCPFSRGIKCICWWATNCLSHDAEVYLS